MTRYIANDTNLKMMMILLKNKSKNIQFEAFHVFKVFLCEVSSDDKMIVTLPFSGVCREPEKAASNRDHPSKEQRKVVGVSEELP
jgi:hypothetical protein